MIALRAAAALALVAAAVGGALAVGLGRHRPGAAPAASPSPGPTGANAPAPTAGGPVTPLALPGPLPPLPASLLARAAGARALAREACPEAPGGVADLEAGCAEPRQAVEIRWHVSDEP